MIKVNLLPVKKRKKSKPIPAFLLATIGITLLASVVMAYLVFAFSSKVSARKKTVAQNDLKITELKEKIKAVEDYEKRNAIYKQRKEIIEQLGKNKTVPVKVVDELSAQLPVGVWLNTMDVKGSDISLSCTAFTNSDVVNYVNSLKNSKLLSDVYLVESVQTKIAETAAYNFKVTMKVKA